MAVLKPIKQSDPPPMKRASGPRGSKYDPMIEELKKKPGKWFLVCEDVTTTTSRVFKQRGCQVTSRRHEGTTKNRVDIWAMWPAENSADNQSKPKKTAAKKAASPRPTAKKR